mgnify:CR=1 FL=1|uniref:LexA family protein n=1 Tax=uncultured Flavonifractor sp. TaxID=1193534 RepID=UPI00344DE7AB
MKKLQAKRAQIYDYIVEFLNHNGYPPSIREIGEHVHIKSTSAVNYHLKKLEKDGFISRAEGKARSIVVLDIH